MENTGLTQAFKQQLDALGERLALIRAGKLDRKSELDRILVLLGGASARPEGSVWDPKLSLTREDGNNVSLCPAEFLNELLKDRGHSAYALSHGASVARGMQALATGDLWWATHRSQFARLALELLAALSLPAAEQYRDLPLNVLVVDNKPDQIREHNELLPPELGFLFWRKAVWWRVKGDIEAKGRPFEKLREQLREGKLPELEEWKLSQTEAPPVRAPGPRDIDLILQDQFLGSKVSGLELAQHYYEAMPSALVFLTTGLDVQAVVSLDKPRFCDRIVPKRHLAALPWYYVLAFTEIMGSMFWESWLSVGEQSSPLESRGGLRSLLGTIRRWQREPEILWHGQALAELVDHGNEHITDLWRLSDEILGARRQDQTAVIGLDQVTTAERVLFALAVWLHDIGHRGDDLSVDPPRIRDTHASISEHLILQRPEAFGVEWLLTQEQHKELANGQELNFFAERNNVTTQPLPPLRMVGLLCRHHQSSAPLFAHAVAGLHYGLKPISDYSRIAWNGDGEPLSDPLKSWRDADADLPWLAHDVVALEDFEKAGDGGPSLLKCGCLLRLVDAIHESRRRAGSATRMKTHRLYRDNRKVWVRRRTAEVQRVMARTPVGSKAYLDKLSELLGLAAYADLLEMQDVHLWRQYVVHRCSARFDEGANAIKVTYRLLPSGNVLWEKSDFKEFKKALEKKYKITGELAVWRKNFIEDVLQPELRGQARPSEPTYLRQHVFKCTDLIFQDVTQEGSEEAFFSLHGASQGMQS